MMTTQPPPPDWHSITQKGLLGTYGSVGGKEGSAWVSSSCSIMDYFSLESPLWFTPWKLQEDLWPDPWESDYDEVGKI